MKKAGFALVLMAFATPSWADSPLPDAELAYTQLPDAGQEKSAKALMEEIRCLVCQGQSVADSDAQLAGDIRAMIRRRISAGESAATIKAGLVDSYGAYITYDPPFSGGTAFLWFLPIIALGVGGWLARGRFRKRVR